MLLPLGYKFSRFSCGVRLTLFNDATFLLSYRTVTVPGSQLMAAAHPHSISPAFAFMTYPNDDSVPYREWYGIGESETVVRATLRYQGFPSSQGRWWIWGGWMSGRRGG